jgi:hypothetical protein
VISWRTRECTATQQGWHTSGCTRKHLESPRDGCLRRGYGCLARFHSPRQYIQAAVLGAGVCEGQPGGCVLGATVGAEGCGHVIGLTVAVGREAGVPRIGVHIPVVGVW